MGFLREDAVVRENSIPQRMRRAHALRAPANRLFEKLFLLHGQAAVRTFPKMRFQRSPLGIEQLSIDQRRDQLLRLVTSHFCFALFASPST